jgi:hypothetical protein
VLLSKGENMNVDKQLVVWQGSKLYKYPESLIKDEVRQKSNLFESEKLAGTLQIVSGPDMLVRFEIFNKLLTEESEFEEPRIINVTDLLR